jgi:hypothetical protein
VPDWDEDRHQLRKNLAHVLREIAGAAGRRETPTLETARRWQTFSSRAWTRPIRDLSARFAAKRYGVPPFVRLRPRPNAGYGEAGAKAMQGDWKPTAVLFQRLLGDFLNE